MSCKFYRGFFVKALFLLLLPISAYAEIKIHALRLTPGQDVRKEIEAFVQKEKVSAGSILSAVGSLKEAQLRYANKSEVTGVKGPLEIVSLSGTLGTSGSHLHMSVSDGEGKTVGGHLTEGSFVYTTLELVIGVYGQMSFERGQDPKTGYKELVIKQK